MFSFKMKANKTVEKLEHYSEHIQLDMSVEEMGASENKETKHLIKPDQPSCKKTRCEGSENNCCS